MMHKLTVYVTNSDSRLDSNLGLQYDADGVKCLEY